MESFIPYQNRRGRPLHPRNPARPRSRRCPRNPTNTRPRPRSQNHPRSQPCRSRRPHHGGICAVTEAEIYSITCLKRPSFAIVGFRWIGGPPCRFDCACSTVSMFDVTVETALKTSCFTSLHAWCDLSYSRERWPPKARLTVFLRKSYVMFGVFAIISAIRQVKFHPSGTIISEVSLFDWVIFLELHGAHR